MPICSDPAIAYLKEFGYSVLRLPRRDFRPLLILAEQGRDLVPLGELATIMVAGPTIKLPPIKADIPATSITGRRTRELSVGVGLSIIGTVIGAMGGGKLGLDAKYKDAKSVAFEFTDVLTDDVEIAALDQFLGASDIDPASQHVATLLDADEIYVVTAVLKSSKFTVEATAQGGGSLDVKVPELQGIVGGNVTVSGSAGQSGKITYQATSPLVFGFQAIQLFYDDGHYTAFEPLAAGEMASRDLLQAKLPEGVKARISPGAFARVRT